MEVSYGQIARNFQSGPLLGHHPKNARQSIPPVYSPCRLRLPSAQQVLDGILGVRAACNQGWHISIGRYRISANMGYIGKTNISVSVSTTVDIYLVIGKYRVIYRSILLADISVMT